MTDDLPLFGNSAAPYGPNGGQQYSSDGTRQERTFWRDEAISQRHRDWGFNCPCVDLDFLVAEYNVGKPVALIEYKHHIARMPNVQHPTYRALTDLSDNYAPNGKPDPLPFMVVFYWPDIWAFKTYPVNEVAAAAFRKHETITEYEYVRRLYALRRRTLTKELEGKLNKLLPEAAA